MPEQETTQEKELTIEERTKNEFKRHLFAFFGSATMVCNAFGFSDQSINDCLEASYEVLNTFFDIKLKDQKDQTV